MLVREALAGLAEAIALDGNDLYDIQTAVTEACNNVVLHAYGEEEGPLDVEIYSFPHAIEVVVRDRGIGIASRAPSASRDPATPDRATLDAATSAPLEDALADRAIPEDAPGLGVPVMRALASRLQLRGSEGGGSEVHMAFLAASAVALRPLARQAPGLPDLARAELASTTSIAIAPTGLARAVLPRLLCVLAARAHFSTDRISDAQLVADALVAQTPESIDGGQLGVSITVRPRNLDLSIGPLRRGRARWRIVNSAIAGLSPVVERLTSYREVVAMGPVEALSLRLSDGRLDRCSP